MIYGKGGKGNFPVLEKMAMKMPLFPKVDNARSMLYVGNLAEFVRLMIDNEESGIFWPCNKEWSNTSELVRMIAECHGKKVRLVPGFGWALKGMSHVTGYVNKAFGNLAYEKNLGDYKVEYRLYSLKQSIRETEG
jgi:UDP-glucose 4-epimerase